MNPSSVYRFPEWKQLYDALFGEILYGELLSYSRIRELADIYILNPDPKKAQRGRAQFQRFAREMLEKRSIHFEAVRKMGYRAVQPNEHVPSGSNRVGRARRRIADAGRILKHTEFSRLSDKERAQNIDALLHVQCIAELMTEHHMPILKGKPTPRLPSPAMDRYQAQKADENDKGK